MIIRYQQHALRDLKKIEKKKRLFIVEQINTLEKYTHPLDHPKVKKIVNSPSGMYRLKADNYRVIFSEEGEVAMILHVRKRNESSYRNL